MRLKLIALTLLIFAATGCGAESSECANITVERAEEIALARYEESKATNPSFNKPAKIARISLNSGSLRDHADVFFELNNNELVTLKIYGDCSSH
ncbi:hypothetical protein [Pseudoblastomonas halimionae]|uniref:Uncharacterized protein n=1 Tax=Alteriqipengyuania halimionae TaxID=1926630 RepID=A0A6I4U379_9SPHN|nr:hypothetical protein [Alteriqipengyuania halimionae]MXP08942.1 hypothetical protein [Alteriqipengyuania halimionae]